MFEIENFERTSLLLVKKALLEISGTRTIQELASLLNKYTTNVDILCAQIDKNLTSNDAPKSLRAIFIWHYIVVNINNSEFFTLFNANRMCHFSTLELSLPRNDEKSRNLIHRYFQYLISKCRGDFAIISPAESEGETEIITRVSVLGKMVDEVLSLVTNHHASMPDGAVDLFVRELRDVTPLYSSDVNNLHKNIFWRLPAGETRFVFELILMYDQHVDYVDWVNNNVKAKSLVNRGKILMGSLGSLDDLARHAKNEEDLMRSSSLFFTIRSKEVQDLVDQQLELLRKMTVCGFDVGPVGAESHNLLSIVPCEETEDPVSSHAEDMLDLFSGLDWMILEQGHDGSDDGKDLIQFE